MDDKRIILRYKKSSLVFQAIVGVLFIIAVIIAFFEYKHLIEGQTAGEYLPGGLIGFIIVYIAGMAYSIYTRYIAFSDLGLIHKGIFAEKLIPYEDIDEIIFPKSRFDILNEFRLILPGKKRYLVSDLFKNRDDLISFLKKLKDDDKLEDVELIFG